MSKKIPLIIDCDPGLDDAIALLLACKSEVLDVLGVTVVGGNQILEKTFHNARNVLAYAGITTVPVAAGHDRPLVRPLHTAPEVHGDSGIGDFIFEPSTQPLLAVHGVDFIAQLLQNATEKVTIAALGPLTNIASFIRKYPHLLDRINRICLMGGAIHGGNVTPCAEFNFYVDPEAAHIVFESDIPIVMCGLDITHKAKVFKEEIQTIRAQDQRVATMVADLLDFYSKYYTDGCNLHDALVIAYLIDPTMVQSKLCHVAIELHGTYTTGMSVVDFENTSTEYKNATVCYDLDRSSFIQLLLQSIQKYRQ